MLGATALGFVSPKGLPITGFHVRSNMHAPCTHARPHDFVILNPERNLFSVNIIRRMKLPE